MTRKIKGLGVLFFTFALTFLIAIFKDLDPGYEKGNWVLWVFWSWNYFAYAFDKRMLPWQFSELKAGREGNPTARTIAFWGTAGVYLAFLALAAFYG